MFQKPTEAQRNEALDYLMSMTFADGQTFASYFEGSIEKGTPVNLRSIAGIAAAYHRDKSPMVIPRTGRKFKELGG